jgi:hypothetical protein
VPGASGIGDSTPQQPTNNKQKNKQSATLFEFYIFYKWDNRLHKDFRLHKEGAIIFKEYNKFQLQLICCNGFNNSSKKIDKVYEKFCKMTSQLFNC